VVEGIDPLFVPYAPPAFIVKNKAGQACKACPAVMFTPLN
jgi:hypothetical protein